MDFGASATVLGDANRNEVTDAPLATQSRVSDLKERIARLTGSGMHP